MNSNFGFLSKFSILWTRFNSANDLAASHPDESLSASRVSAELLLDKIGEARGAPRIREGRVSETQEAYIDRLSDIGCISKTQAKELHWLRITANKAVHGERLATAETAHKALSTLQGFALEFRGELDSGSIGAIKLGEPDTRPEEEDGSDDAASEKKNSLRKFVGRRWLLFVALLGSGLAFAWLASYLLQPPPTWPQTYTVTPGPGHTSANVRSGVGGDYRLVRSLPRGASITGVAEANDTNGAAWIELSDGSGFMKETVLRKAETTSTGFWSYVDARTLKPVKGLMFPLLAIVVGGALLYWLKIRLSTIVFWIIIALVLIRYQSEIRSLGSIDGAIYALSQWTSSISRVPTRAPAVLSDDDFDCGPSHHCTFAFNGSSETTSLSLTDRYGRGSGVRFCTDVALWVGENRRAVFHGWRGASDLGIILITRAEADAEWTAGHAPMFLDRIAFRRVDQSLETISYWLTRSATCN